jgi:hypothetical protein
MVKNFINNTYFFEWDEATTAAYFKRIPGAVGITIPKLVEMAAEQVELASVPFASFIANKKQGGASASYSFRAPGLCAALAREDLGRVRSCRPHRHYGSTGISQAAYRQVAPHHQDRGDIAACRPALASLEFGLHEIPRGRSSSQG